MNIEDYIIYKSIGNVYWKDNEGRYLGANETYLKFLNLKSIEELVGKSDFDFFPAHVAQRLKEVDKSIREKDEEITLEESGYDIQGNPCKYLSRKAPLKDANNNIIGIVGTSIDIKNYLTIQDYILNHTTGNLYWKDYKGYYLGCNESFAKMVHLTPKEVEGKNDYELHLKTLGEEKLKAILEIDQMVMMLGKEQVIEEVGVDSEGKLAIYMTKKMPLRDKNNKVIGIVGTSIDVTKQKQAERAKSEFLRNMSHDIMTPFTGILGISRMLYEDETDEEKKLNLHYLVQSSERLLELLKQILEVAEIGNNRELKITEFNIKTLVEEIVATVISSVKLRGLTLTFNCPNKFIRSDRLRINRILINFISNAIKFTEQGSIHIDVICDEFLEISVSDTGIGIPENKLDIIFEQFEKLSESSKHSQFMGAGIGLYITKELAHELSGEITVSSKFGEGSIFTFKQPLFL